MKQWLTRGFPVAEQLKITRMIVSDENWQIYLTNQETYVIAVDDVLYEKWVDKYSLPTNIFKKIDLCNEYWVFCSSSNYIVSSIDKGPYPDNLGQIEAFSVAFSTVLKLFPNICFDDAIYIEEYSLILPSRESTQKFDLEVIYGRWLTGGVNISVNSFSRMTQLMSWVPASSLKKSIQLAGFSVNEREELLQECENIEEIENKKDYEKIAKSLEKKGKFSLVGRPELESFFNDNIIEIVLNQEQYRRMGISNPGATILYGPPGCGKTYAVEKLSEYLGWKRFDIDSSAIASSYIHETSRKISDVFNMAISSAPSIIVIDEMEAFLSNRNATTTSGVNHIEEVAEFLRRIPEAISKGVLVFAMTNMIDTIDPAILRRGRFDYIIEVKMANKDEIASLLHSKFNNLPICDDVDVENIAYQLEGHPLSDITFILKEAGKVAVRSGYQEINQECFNKALNLLPKKEEKRKIGFTQ